MFPNTDFQSVLDQYVEARLHNDKNNAASERIMDLQDKYIGHRALPVYMAMDPVDEEVLGKFELPALGDQRTALLEFLRNQRGRWEEKHAAPPSP